MGLYCPFLFRCRVEELRLTYPTVSDVCRNLHPHRSQPPLVGKGRHPLQSDRRESQQLLAASVGGLRFRKRAVPVQLSCLNTTEFLVLKATPVSLDRPSEDALGKTEQKADPGRILHPRRGAAGEQGLGARV
jgi:hypothetical protein